MGHRIKFNEQQQGLGQQLQRAQKSGQGLGSLGSRGRLSRRTTHHESRNLNNGSTSRLLKRVGGRLSPPPPPLPLRLAGLAFPHTPRRPRPNSALSEFPRRSREKESEKRSIALAFASLVGSASAHTPTCRQACLGCTHCYGIVIQQCHSSLGLLCSPCSSSYCRYRPFPT